MTRDRVRRTSAALAALLLGGGLLAGCADDGLQASADTGYVAGKGVITALAEADREAPGEVAGETLEGEPVSLADHAGQVVVLNVWGSWCPPCRAEAPELVAAAEELADDGVVFLGINTRDHSRAAAEAFQRRFDVPYPSIFDPHGENLLAFHGTLSPNTIPSTVVIDEQGRVAASVLGEVTRGTLVGLVEEVTG